MCNDKNVVQYSRKVELFRKHGLELDMLTMDDIGSSLYAVDMYSKSFSGMIVDSNEITDNISYTNMPNMIEYYRTMFDFLSWKNYYSKAFFVLNGDSALEIIKNDNGIVVGYKVRKGNCLDDEFIIALPTLSSGKLFSLELSSIVNTLKNTSSDELGNMVCDELEIYGNICRKLNDKNQVQDVIQLSSPFMLPIVDWDKTVNTLRNSEPVKLTEDIIENYSNEFGVTIDDIVGVEDKSQIEGHKSWVKQIKHKNV